jgi:diguanylate cyclase (GGDEF)-like protein
MKISIKWKVLGLLLATTILMVSVQHMAQGYVIFPSFLALEEHDARQNLERAVLAIDREVEHLDKTTFDYASWDDSCNFMETADPAFIDANFEPSVFTNMRLALIQFVATDGRVVFQRAVRDGTEDLVPIKGLPTGRYTIGDRLITHDRSLAPLDKRSVAGIVLLDGQPMLIASRPIISSHYEGPIRGTLVFGRRLNDEFRRSLVEQTRVPFDIEVATSRREMPTVARLEREGLGPSKIFIEPQSSERLVVRALMHDLDGRPAVVLHTVIPREITAQGLAAIRWAMGATFALSVLICVVALFAVTGLVVRPIVRLTKHAAEIERNGDFSVRLAASIKRTDEIGVLSSTFDRMIERIQAQTEELERLSVMDGLTKIANRRSFDRHLETEWRRLTRTQRPLSLVLGDVDFFKRFNDAYGHCAGDDCLRAVARVFGTHARRAGDLAARYGGEEFVLLLPETTAAGALVVAENVRAAIEALGLEHRAADLGHVTVSLGVASYFPDTDSPPTALVETADQALYAAKSKGRNRVVAHEPQRRSRPSGQSPHASTQPAPSDV